MSALSQIASPKSILKVNDDLRSLLEHVAGTGPVDVMAFRMLIEPQAAAAAASNATDGDLASIAQAHEIAVAETDQSSFELLDAEFHRRIVMSTRNDILTCLDDILRVIRSQKSWLEIKRRSFSESRRDGYAADHQLIVNALMSRDPIGAAKAMKAHLAAVNRNLFGDDRS